MINGLWATLCRLGESRALKRDLLTTEYFDTRVLVPPQEWIIGVNSPSSGATRVMRVVVAHSGFLNRPHGHLDRIDIYLLNQ